MFSIIIPMYNSEKTILKALNSVMNQTFKDFEVLVINDGSSDNSQQIVENYIQKNKFENYIKLFNKKNGGVSSARNLGIANATKDYISFLDADDIWHIQKLEIMKHILLNNKDIKFIGHNHTFKNENNILNINNIKAKKINFYQLLLKNFATTPSIVIKNDTIEYFNEDMSHMEDYELWLRLALKTEPFYLDEKLVILGREPNTAGGLSAKRWQMRKNEIKAYINISNNNKKIFLLLPFLILFSLFKYLIMITMKGIK